MCLHGDLVLYDDPDVRDAAAHASAKELGNGLLFIKKAGRGRVDLLVALSLCASEAQRVTRYRPSLPLEELQAGLVAPSRWKMAQDLPKIRRGMFSRRH